MPSLSREMEDLGLGMSRRSGVLVIVVPSLEDNASDSDTVTLSSNAQTIKYCDLVSEKKHI